MGDRVIVVFKDKYNTYSPGIYLHTSGAVALILVEEAACFMRAGDKMFSAAAFCGYCFKQITEDIDGHKPHISLRWPPEEDENGKIDWTDYSPRDAGVVVVDVNSGFVNCFSGYLEGQTIDNLFLPDW